MAIKSKIRLEQLTGSLVELKPVDAVSVGATAASASEIDLKGVLKYYAQALSNIHGNAEFGANAVGTFQHDIQPGVSGGQGLGILGISPAAGDSFVGSHPSSAAFSVGSATASGTANATTTRIHYDGSGTPSGVSPGDLILLGSSSGFMVFTVTGSGASAGATQIDVAYVANLSTFTVLNQGDMTSERKASTSDVLAVEWSKVATPKLSAQAALIIENGIKSAANDIEVKSSQHVILDSPSSDPSGGIKLQSLGGVNSIIAGVATQRVKTGQVEILPSTTATSTSTGALRVFGGAGIAENLHIGGTGHFPVLSGTLVDLNGGNIDGTVIGAATRQSALFTTLGANGQSSLTALNAVGVVNLGASGVASTILGTLDVEEVATFDLESVHTLGLSSAGVVDITNDTDATDATGDTGALRTEGGASIAKKLYVGTDGSVAGDLVVGDDLSLTSDAAVFTAGATNPFTITHALDGAGGTIGTSPKLGLVGSTELNLNSPDLLMSSSAGNAFIGGDIAKTGASALGTDIFAFSGVRGGGLVISQLGSGDAADFISKFSNSTSILEAINSNKASITSQEATVFQRSLTGSVAAQIPYLLVGADSLRVGDVANFENTVGLNQADVFVNGQMMLSGTVADYSASLSDYKVSAQNTLVFNFDLKSGDVVKLIERS